MVERLSKKDLEDGRRKWQEGMRRADREHTPIEEVEDPRALYWQRDIPPSGRGYPRGLDPTRLVRTDTGQLPLKEAIKSALPARARLVYCLLYEADPSWTQKEIAEVLCVTRQSISYYKKRIFGTAKCIALCVKHAPE